MHRLYDIRSLDGGKRPGRTIDLFNPASPAVGVSPLASMTYDNTNGRSLNIKRVMSRGYLIKKNSHWYNNVLCKSLGKMGMTKRNN